MSPAQARASRSESRGGELFAGKLEVARAHAVGEEAEVADADEALGQDVQQIAAQELVSLEVHDLLAVAVAIVLGREPHPLVVEAKDASLGDGDAVA